MTQGRPIPKATNSIQQRLELELLLQVSVLSHEELLVGVELMANHTTLDISTWQQFQALPINMHNQHLVVAISDQCNEQTKNQLISVLQSQGFSTEFRLALASDISQLLAPMRSEQHVESASKSKTTKPIAQTPTSLLAGFSAEGVLEEDPEEQARLASSVEDLESSLMDSDSSPVINLVDRILLEALQTEASDVHVEPQQDGLQIRFRQDGVLQRYIEPLPSRLIPAVTSRFKIMADLDIAERRMAQDGRIRRTYRNRMVDFRVNSLPSRYGEKSVCDCSTAVLHNSG